MGNQIFWCYADQDDQEDTQLSQQYQNVNGNVSENKQDISLQQEKKEIRKLQLENFSSQISSNSLKQECDFCASYLQKLDIKQKKKNNNQSHPIHEENFRELHVQSDTLTLLHNDPITIIVSTWFQLAIALPKIVQNNDGIIQTKFLEQKLNCEELQTLICLKWGVIDFFKLSQQIKYENNIIRECFQMFKRVFHYCIFFNELFLENCSEINQIENIKLYIECYEYYQNLMNAHANKYEQLIDEMQLIYQKQFNFQNKDNQYPHFKVIGYMMRFWCQIMLSDNIQSILKDSFKKLDQIKDQTLYYQYVVYALDININEDNVHWIGHRINFKFDKKLLIDQHWLKVGKQIKSSDQDYYTKIDQILKNQKMLYPSWFYDVEIEYKVIQDKIKSIANQLKQDSTKSSFFSQSYDTELEDQTQSESLNKSLSSDSFQQKESIQKQQDHLTQLLMTNEMSETCDSQDFTDTLDSIKQRLSNDSKISTEDCCHKQKPLFNIQKLTEFISDLIKIKKRLRQREFMLSQRAKKYKLTPNRKIEWLGFFEKTCFHKIPDSQQQLRKYIELILNKLMSVDDHYKKQREYFL